jgi:exodeoxyribonuclease VII small subunit
MTKSADSYKEQQEKLTTLLDTLQSEDVDVDEALKLYDEATRLIEQMEERLQKAKNHVEQLKNRQA